MLKIGDTIKCSSPSDMVEVMMELQKRNIETEFLYEKDGQKGYWLVITKYGEEENDRH